MHQTFSKTDPTPLIGFDFPQASEAGDGQGVLPPLADTLFSLAFPTNLRSVKIRLIYDFTIRKTPQNRCTFLRIGIVLVQFSAYFHAFAPIAQVAFADNQYVSFSCSFAVQKVAGNCTVLIFAKCLTILYRFFSPKLQKTVVLLCNAR